MVLQLQSLHHMWLMLTIFMPHVVSGLGSLCHMQVAVTIFAPHVVLQLQSLHCIGVAVAIFAPCECHSYSHHAILCCSCGGYHCAVWCCSCSHHCHVVTGPQKRKLVEKRKKK